MEETVGKHLTTGQIRELIDIDRSHGGVGSEVQALIKHLASDSAFKVKWVGKVAVDYGTRPSYQELNGGWFDWANERYGDTLPEQRKLEAKPLPTTGTIQRRYGYVYLGRSIVDGLALAEIANRRVVPASDLEAMYFGRTFPNEQLRYPIVALRTFFRRCGYCFSAVLHKFKSGRDLGLRFSKESDPWPSDCRFLVREDSE